MGLNRSGDFEFKPVGLGFRAQSWLFCPQRYEELVTSPFG